MNLIKQYLHARLGWSYISPIIGIINFFMIGYIAVKSNNTITTLIPIDTLMPILVISFIIIIFISGNLIRKRELKIDSTINYEHAPEPAKTARILFDDLHKIQKHMGIEISQESINRCRYMRDIEGGKFGK